MISFQSFSDELVKIAEAQPDYKRVKAEGRTVLLRRGVPLVGKLPKNPDRAVQKLHSVIRSERAKHKTLGYSNVAVRQGALDLKASGFKPTRLATPLPGEGLLSTTWRRGPLHVHKQGPLYLVHEDKEAPYDPETGYMNRAAIRHAFKEGLPSMVKRFTKCSRPLVKEEEK